MNNYVINLYFKLLTFKWMSFILDAIILKLVFNTIFNILF